MEGNAIALMGAGLGVGLCVIGAGIGIGRLAAGAAEAIGPHANMGLFLIHHLVDKVDII